MNSFYHVPSYIHINNSPVIQLIKSPYQQTPRNTPYPATPINPSLLTTLHASSQYRNDLVQLIVGKPIRASKLDRKGDAHTAVQINRSNNDGTNEKDSSSRGDANEVDQNINNDYNDATSNGNERDVVT